MEAYCSWYKLCKLKEKWLSLLKPPNKVGYGGKRIDADKFREKVVKLNSEFVAACPSANKNFTEA